MSKNDRKVRLGSGRLFHLRVIFFVDNTSYRHMDNRHNIKGVIGWDGYPGIGERDGEMRKRN